MKKRIEHFDNMKGVLIILVLLGHLVSPLRTESIIAASIYKFVYSFHMPLFIMISGYFAKKPKLKNDIKLLLILMPSQILFTWDIYGEVIPFSFHFGLWYLMSLFFWRRMVAYIKNPKILIGIALILGLFSGYFSVFGRFLALARTFRMMIFFVIGFIASKEDYKKYSNIINPWAGLAILTSTFIVMLLLIQFTNISVYNMWFSGSRTYDDLMNGTLLFLGPVIQLSVYALSLSLAITALNTIPKKKIPVANEVGKMTLYFFTGQAYWVYALRYKGFYEKWNLNTFHMFLLTILWSLIIFGLFYLMKYYNNKKEKVKN